MAPYSNSFLEENQSFGYSHFLTKILTILEIEEKPTPSDLIASIRHGFPFSVFEVVQEEIDLPQKELSDIIGISPRTISRRKEENHLTPLESDRLYRFIRVLTFAVDVLGDIEKARAWLKNPNFEFGGEIPIELLGTDIGVEMVEDVLKRIKYGIYG